MNPKPFYNGIVYPVLNWMADTPEIKTTAANNSRALIMATAGQESAWKERRQIGGPARSYWQFEKGGGVSDVFRVAPNQLRYVCNTFDIPFDPTTVFEAMAWHDELACAMARLNYWINPAPLPAFGDVEANWQYYLDTWRPGMPHHDTWAGYYKIAVDLVTSAV